MRYFLFWKSWGLLYSSSKFFSFHCNMHKYFFLKMPCAALLNFTKIFQLWTNEKNHLIHLQRFWPYGYGAKILSAVVISRLPWLAMRLSHPCKSYLRYVLARMTESREYKSKYCSDRYRMLKNLHIFYSIFHRKSWFSTKLSLKFLSDIQLIVIYQAPPSWN